MRTGKKTLLILALGGLTPVLVIIAVALAGSAATGASIHEYWRIQIGGGRLLVTLVVMFVVTVGFYALLRGLLEDVGFVEPAEQWQDWRDAPLPHESRPQSHTRKSESKPFLGGRPCWTHRGRIRSRRYKPPAKYWGYIRQ